MDKKLISEDIQNIKYLFGYKPGRVISEQDYDYTTDYYLDTTENNDDEDFEDWEKADDDEYLRRKSGEGRDIYDDDEFMDYDGDDASTWPGANYGDEDEWLDNDDLEDFDKWSKKLPDMTYKPKHSQSLTDEDGMPW
jgi:hypothetical protein